MITRNLFSVAVLLPLVCASLAGCSKKSTTSSNATTSATPAGTKAAPPGPATLQPSEGAGDAIKLAADYEQKCGGQTEQSIDCDALRSLLVAEVWTALETVERSRDQRGVEPALAALDLADEPEIFIEACRILGQFPTTAGIAEKVLPQLLANRYIEVQRISANLLSTVAGGAGEAGRLWLGNHSELTSDTLYDEYPDFPAHYAAIGFPKYPGAEWFSPADSDRSIGWSTKDDADAVTRWFSQSLHAEPMNMQQWLQQANQSTAALQSGDYQSKAARMAQLMEKVVKGDQAATAEVEKLQKEIAQASDVAKAAVDNGAARATNPSDSAIAQARWIVAKRKGEHISSVVLVYPLAGLQRTVIQLAWDLADYPSAWPKSKG